jgi:hypothetical protein
MTHPALRRQTIGGEVVSDERDLQARKGSVAIGVFFYFWEIVEERT